MILIFCNEDSRELESSLAWGKFQWKIEDRIGTLACRPSLASVEVVSCSGELWNETFWCEIWLPSWCSCHHESLDAMQRSNQKSWCCSETLLSLETCYNIDWSLHECINSDESCDDLHLNLILTNKIIRWFACVFYLCHLFCCFIPM